MSSVDTIMVRTLFFMMAIPCFAVGALLALLVDLPARGDDTSPPAPIWLEVGALPEALASVDAAVYMTRGATYAYLTGGKRSDGTASDNITLVELRDPGPVGLGSVRPLPVPLYGHAAVVACARLYIIGGWDGVRWHADVWSAAIEPNGALGAWRTEIGYPFPVAFHDAVALDPDCDLGARLFVLGGARLEASAAAVEAALASGDPLAAPDSEAIAGVDASTSNSNQVYYSTIYLDGMSSTWRATTPLPAALSRHAAAIWKDVVVVTGGYDGKTVQARAYAARIADGGIGSWQASDLPQPVEYHAVAVLGGRLWLLGGRSTDDGNASAAVLSAGLLPRSSPALGPWNKENDLPRPLIRLVSFAAECRKHGVYFGGGIRKNGKFDSEIARDVLPGIESLQLVNEPNGLVSPNDVITYSLLYMTGGATLEDVVITRSIPSNTAAHFVDVRHVVGPLPADSIRKDVYTVTSESSNLIANPGVVVEWGFGSNRYTQTSNAVLNNAIQYYFPYIGRYEREANCEVSRGMLRQPQQGLRSGKQLTTERSSSLKDGLVQIP